MSPDLHELFRFMVSNSTALLSNIGNLNMSYHRYMVEQKNSFTRTMHILKKIIEVTRIWYEKVTGSQQPFLYISHDIWETKKVSVLGVTVHLIVPHVWTMEQFPVGLSHCTSHKAIDVLRQTNVILKR